MTETEDKKQEDKEPETEEKTSGEVAAADVKSASESDTETQKEEPVLDAGNALSGFTAEADEEESIQDICNRYLNIFRQLHVLSESSILRYNEEIKEASEDVIFDLYSLPGGLELVDYITFLRTGEKVNSRRLRARQKQEEELGFAPKKEAKKEAAPAPQPVAQQPIIQYVPMPAVSGDGNAGTEAMASMQSMMAQFVSMQQTMQSSPSLSASDLATALLSGQKELMAQQTKNYLEGQKALLSMQTKAFVDGQKTLIDLQRNLAKETEETLLSMQEKLLNEAREAIDKNQKILFAMQKSMLDEMTGRIEQVINKVAENAKPVVDYDILNNIQEKFSTVQSDTIKAIGKENIEAMEKVADSIKNLQIVSNNVVNASVLPSENVTDSHSENIQPAKNENQETAVKTENHKVETITASERLKESDFLSEDENEFIRMGREKRRERFKKHHHVNVSNSEDTITVSHDKSFPKGSVFVEPKTEENKENDDPKIDSSVAVTSEGEVNASSPISDVVGENKEPKAVSSALEENKKTEEETEIVPISDTVGNVADAATEPVSAPAFSSENVIQPSSGQNEPPLAEDNVSSSSGASDVAASIYNRPKVEDIHPDSEAYIPVQGSLDNLPPPGVMTEKQLSRTEKNIGFAINEGSYKGGAEGGYREEPKKEDTIQSYTDDPFSKKISPRSVSRFKVKKSGNNHDKDANNKKGIFSVFKKLVTDEDSSDV